MVCQFLRLKMMNKKKKKGKTRERNQLNKKPQDFYVLGEFLDLMVYMSPCIRGRPIQWSDFTQDLNVAVKVVALELINTMLSVYWEPLNLNHLNTVFDFICIRIVNILLGVSDLWWLTDVFRGLFSERAKIKCLGIFLKLVFWNLGNVEYQRSKLNYQTESCLKYWS